MKRGNVVAPLIAAILALVAAPALAHSPPTDGEQDEHWILELDLTERVAVSGAGIGMNQNQPRVTDPRLRGLGARYWTEVQATVTRRLELGPLRGVFVFWRQNLFNGRNTPALGTSWGFDHVMHYRQAGGGFVFPHGLSFYVESMGHPDFGEEFRGLHAEGPFELYNLFFLRKEGRLDFDAASGTSGPHLLYDAEFGIGPPHNEIGINTRRPDLPETNGFGDNYARYAIRGHVRLVVPLAGDLPIRSAWAFVNPFFMFGKTIPQQHYTWDPRYIGARRNLGAGVTLEGGWEVFAEFQFRWHIADEEARPRFGPYEDYTAIGVSKSFSWGF